MAQGYVCKELPMIKKRIREITEEKAPENALCYVIS